MFGRTNNLRFEQLEDRRLLAAVAGDFNGNGFDDLVVGLPDEMVAGHANAGIVQVSYGAAGGLQPGTKQSFHLLDLLPPATNATGARFGHALAVGDFNGDGYDDLAIGVPGMDIYVGSNLYASAGMVFIFHGSPSGLQASGAQMLSIHGFGRHVWWEGDQFGYSLAAGDLNGDGYDDLAIGAPWWQGGYVNGRRSDDVGSVHVVHGSSDGLDSSTYKMWTQDSPGIKGSSSGSGSFFSDDDFLPDRGDRFGYSLAIGDFDGDGYDDLAIGVPGKDLQKYKGPFRKWDAGAVNVIYGSPGGLTAEGNQRWTLNSWSANGLFGVVPIEGSASSYDEFGTTLAVGNFNGDGYDDLVIGTPNKKVGNSSFAGAVNVIYGTADGLHATGNKMLTQNDSPLLKFGYGAGSQYGRTLAVGDFDGSGRDDLAIGWSNKTVGDARNAGLVHVIFSATYPLTTYREMVLAQGHGGMADQADAGDRFGRSLAAGDFDGDGKTDLAILVPGEKYKGTWHIGAPAKPGAVHVRYGSFQEATVRDQLFFLHGLYLNSSGTAAPLYDSVITQPDEGSKSSWPTLADYVLWDYALADTSLDASTSGGATARGTEDTSLFEAAALADDSAATDGYFDQMGQTTLDGSNTRTGFATTSARLRR